MAFVSLQGGNIATKEMRRLQPIKAIHDQFTLHPLSSAEATVGYHSKNSHNRKIESAGRTMGRGKRRETLPFYAFKMAPDFEEDWNLGGILVDVYKMADMVQPFSVFVRLFQKVNQSGELRCFK